MEKPRLSVVRQREDFLLCCFRDLDAPSRHNIYPLRDICQGSSVRAPRTNDSKAARPPHRPYVRSRYPVLKIHDRMPMHTTRKTRRSKEHTSDLQSLMGFQSPV